MTTSQYSRALEIMKLITELEQHKTQMMGEKKNCIELANAVSNNYTQVCRPEFCPIQFDMFRTLYVSAIEKRIKELDTEFNNL